MQLTIHFDNDIIKWKKKKNMKIIETNRKTILFHSALVDRPFSFSTTPLGYTVV